jgi:hypothetical protein
MVVFFVCLSKTDESKTSWKKMKSGFPPKLTQFSSRLHNRSWNKSGRMLHGSSCFLGLIRIIRGNQGGTVPTIRIIRWNQGGTVPMISISRGNEGGTVPMIRISRLNQGALYQGGTLPNQRGCCTLIICWANFSLPFQRLCFGVIYNCYIISGK